MLDLTGRLVVVVGGGPVGRRRAASARDGGAAVRVIEPATGPTGSDAPHITWVRESYHPAHLFGASLVFACGPAGVNTRVVADAVRAGVWVSSASNPSDGTCVLPAVGRQGGLTLAVSTGGASPALARRIRDRLLTGMDPEIAAWIELLDEIRPAARTRIRDPARRRTVLANLADWHWLDRLRSEGPDAVRAAMWDTLDTTD